MSSKNTTPPCSDEAFVLAWESCNSVAEVVAVCGYSSPNVATNRAARLRARGVRLRSFQGRKNVRKLQWLARRAAAEGVES